MTIGSTGDRVMNGRMISTGKTVKFNPYIQMTYAGQDKVKHNVAVLSEYRREIYPNDYAEISYTKLTDNLLIQSQMWALDANLTTQSSTRPWAGINQVLKGGATIYLTDRETQTVRVSTYQTILEGESQDISEISGSGRGSLTTSDAITYHNEFVNSVKAVFEATEIEQWVSTDTSGEKPWDTSDGIKVYNNASLSRLNNGSARASSESKYYFHTDIDNVKNTQRNDLDVKVQGTNTITYRFYSDVYGNIWMSKNGGSGTKLLSKAQGVDSLTNSEAKAINSRTYAVAKLVDAIERNTGNDTTAAWATEDGHWYNEAYYGITVYVQHTDIAVGITAGINPTRMSVVDPKLIPKVTSKNDQGTTAFSLAFRVDLTNLQALGTFKGTEIGIRDIEDMFESNVVYITNMTVDDNR